MVDIGTPKIERVLLFGMIVRNFPGFPRLCSKYSTASKGTLEATDLPSCSNRRCVKIHFHLVL